MLLLCLLAVMLWQVKKAADAPKQAVASDSKAAVQETTVDWGITMTVSNPTSTGCRLDITKAGGHPTGLVQCGGDWYLQVLKEDGWYDMEMLIDNYAVSSIAYIVSEECPRSWELNWEIRYGVLPPGTYRISKSMTDVPARAKREDVMHFSQPFVIQ